MTPLIIYRAFSLNCFSLMAYIRKINGCFYIYRSLSLHRDSDWLNFSVPPDGQCCVATHKKFKTWPSSAKYFTLASNTIHIKLSQKCHLLFTDLCLAATSKIFLFRSVRNKHLKHKMNHGVTRSGRSNVWLVCSLQDLTSSQSLI